MEILERIVQSPGEPSQKNDLWLDIKMSTPTFKAFLGGIWKVIGGGSASAVSFEKQTLTSAQQEQARENIGAVCDDDALFYTVTGTL